MQDNPVRWGKNSFCQVRRDDRPSWQVRFIYLSVSFWNDSHFNSVVFIIYEHSFVDCFIHCRIYIKEREPAFFTHYQTRLESSDMLRSDWLWTILEKFRLLILEDLQFEKLGTQENGAWLCWMQNFWAMRWWESKKHSHLSLKNFVTIYAFAVHIFFLSRYNTIRIEKVTDSNVSQLFTCTRQKILLPH